MTKKINTIVKISSLTLILSLAVTNSSQAQSFFISHEPASSLISVKSEWRAGQDDIALGNRLIRKGEFDIATGRPILGRHEIAEGRELKAQGRAELDDSHMAKRWLWEGRPFHRW